MNIQWYPGHMTKTRRQIQADLKQVDLVAEIIDARIPISSRNPDIDELVGEKPRLIVLNRADQADPAMHKAWSDWFRKKGGSVLAANARDGKGAGQFSAALQTALKEKLEPWKAPGRAGRAVGGNFMTDACGLVARGARAPLVTIQLVGLAGRVRKKRANDALRAELARAEDSILYYDM